MALSDQPQPAATPRYGCLRRFLALPACVLVTACASVAHGRPATSSAASQTRAAASRQAPSQWPDVANYNAIVIAVKVRDQALGLRPWNEKAYAAQLALRTLATLAGTMRPGSCARFVAHVYDELWDLSDAYPSENWRPMFAVVAHDPSVVSQCAAPRVPQIRARIGPVLTGTPES
jgi:hypothetical protein